MRRQSRRDFLGGSVALAGLGLLAGCGLRLPWQQPKIPRIGYLGVGGSSPALVAFVDGLRDLGYVEGQTIAIEWRWTTTTEQLAGLAADLVSLPVDLIVAATTTAVQAAMAATKTIPIVFPNIGDPVRSGFVASLARPGGNVTGVSDQSVRLQQKRLQMLKDVVPGLSRLLFLQDIAIAEVNGNLALRELQEAGQRLGVQIVRPEFRKSADLPPALSIGVEQQVEALLTSDTPLINLETERIVVFATASRWPLMSQNPPFVTAGGLVSYGVNTETLYGRAATYVDKILKGARPADLPVEQVTTITCVVNLKTARALGLTVPPSVLQQATEVIQ